MVGFACRHVVGRCRILGEQMSIRLCRRTGFVQSVVQNKGCKSSLVGDRVLPVLGIRKETAYANNAVA